MTDPDTHHLQLELQRLTTVLDAQERHLEHIIDVVRAAERLYDTIHGTTPGNLIAAINNLGDALKAIHQ